jgi:transposase
MEKLSQEEIDRRMVELYNYRRLYPELRQKYEQAKLRIQELEEALAREKREREEAVEALKLQIEELREMVFGRKRGGDDGKGASGGRSSDEKETTEKKPRSNISYRRPTPTDKDVTQETMHSIDCCPDCGEHLTNLQEAVRYVEDIIIPALAGLKIVEKQHIETGFCRQCRKWHSAIPIRKQVCSLGENVRMRISYCVTVQGQTIEKIARDLKDTFGITVSDGEMAHIQTMEATKLLPEYHEIDLRICGSPAAHYDETGHPVQKEGQGQHGWVKTASDSPDTIYRLGQTRGKGNAKALIHDRNQPIITDDYSAYDGLSDKHGLCWAHPKRKFQDLAESSTLEDERRQHCKNFYERFCTLLGDVKTIHESPYDRNRRAKEADRFRPLIAALMTPSTHDPKKLATLKKTFLQNTEHYLLCVLEPNIPMTNNKAERAIRPLVIKRKLSFGSKTQKGADVMSILLSVCLTTWWKKPKNFYAAYSDIVRKWQAA